MLRRSRRPLLTGFALLASLSCTAFASAQSVYVCGEGNEFGTLEVTTGIFTPVGTGTTSDLLSGLTFVPNGTLYGINTTADTLYTINKTTGALTTVGSISGVLGSAAGLASAPDGTLFLMDDVSNLYTINPGAGAATLRGSVGNSSVGTIAFVGNNLYEVNDEPLTIDPLASDVLNLLDTNTGTGTPIGTGTGAQFIFGLANVNGTLYGFDDLDDILTINTADGTGSVQGTYTLPNGHSIFATAFPAASPVPEPAAYAFFLSLSLTASGFLLRRRSQARLAPGECYKR